MAKPYDPNISVTMRYSEWLTIMRGLWLLLNAPQHFKPKDLRVSEFTMEVADIQQAKETLLSALAEKVAQNPKLAGKKEE